MLISINSTYFSPPDFSLRIFVRFFYIFGKWNVYRMPYPIEVFTTGTSDNSYFNYTLESVRGNIYVSDVNGSSFSLTKFSTTASLPVPGEIITTNGDSLFTNNETLIAFNTNDSLIYNISKTNSQLYSIGIGIGTYTKINCSGVTGTDLSGSIYFIAFDSTGKLFTIANDNLGSTYIQSYSAITSHSTSFHNVFTLDNVGGNNYKPIQLVFGRDDNELFALCELSTDAKIHAVLRIHNPYSTHEASVYVDGLPELTYSIAYDKYNHKLFISQNINGTQMVTDIRGNSMVDPTGLSADLALVNNFYNTMLFDTDGNLYYPTSTSYIAKALKRLFPLCVAEGTRVLTPNGYIPVEQLKKYDYITTADGRNAIIKYVHHSQHFDASEMEAPFLVPANALSEGVPLHDVKLSPDHLVLVGEDCWLSPRHMAKRSDKVVQYSLGETIQYYAIMTDNYFQDNLVIEDGVVVESYGYRRTVYDETVKAFRRVPEEDVKTE